jgi:hypothetical protein
MVSTADEAGGPFGIMFQLDAKLLLSSPTGVGLCWDVLYEEGDEAHSFVKYLDLLSIALLI